MIVVREKINTELNFRYQCFKQLSSLTEIDRHLAA